MVDTCTLVSASINSLIEELGVNIKHHFYEYSKPLFKHFKENIDKKEGIFTKEIESSADYEINKAVLSEIDFICSKGELSKEGLLDRFSIIQSESIRNLKENKDILIKETINEKEIIKLIPFVWQFFYELGNRIKKEDPIEKAKEILKYEPKIKGLKGFIKGVRIKQQKEDFQGYNWLINKFIRNPPSIRDQEILAQAMYLKQIYQKKEEILFFIASTDTHFVALRSKEGKILNPFVPERIKERFGIDCEWPDLIKEKITS